MLVHLVQHVWTKLKKRASRSSKETVQTGEQLLIMMLRQVLTLRRLSMHVAGFTDD